MDPIKRQDVLLQAMAHLRHRHPGARVVLVGNGSFSGSASTGLGLSEAHRWRAYLEGLARGIGGRGARPLHGGCPPAW